jgi:hypothetical protein
MNELMNEYIYTVRDIKILPLPSFYYLKLKNSVVLIGLLVQISTQITLDLFTCYLFYIPFTSTCSLNCKTTREDRSLEV